MSIEYLVDLDCPPKQALTVDRLIALVKGRSHAAVVVEMSRQRGDQRPPGEMSYTRRVLRPDGPVDETVNIGTLLEETRALDQQAHHCQGCRANLLARPFGCYGSVSYPIAARAEDWLMSLLPNDPGSQAGQLLKTAVTDWTFDGGMFVAMRANEHFFESRTPVKRSWGRPPVAWSMTSDQLLHMLFGLGNLPAPHCKVMAVILGLAVSGGPAPPFPQPPADDRVVPLAQAVAAVGLAAQLGVGLRVDA